MIFRILGLSCVLGISLGCQSTLYDWGTYEQSVLTVSDEAEVDLQKEISRLTEEVTRTEAKKRQVPPGKYAHLGYLCYLVDDHARARSFFEAEKRVFPESAQFIGFMIARLEAQ